MSTKKATPSFVPIQPFSATSSRPITVISGHVKSGNRTCHTVRASLSPAPNSDETEVMEHAPGDLITIARQHIARNDIAFSAQCLHDAATVALQNLLARKAGMKRAIPIHLHGMEESKLVSAAVRNLPPPFQDNILGDFSTIKRISSRQQAPDRASLEEATRVTERFVANIDKIEPSSFIWP
mmetsp:Transcript_289/g.540  ORF Transcript_289/g.540 Transcript_289/m.540 type:complete len:182 (-) Transcript_289:106-651(-)